ncbi:hypothetical protein ACJ41O_003910 [Fusarium nematophilum]
MVSFESIPHELFLSITQHLSPSDLGHFTRIHDESRLREVASRVKSLCTVISSSSDFWHLLPYFTNLESLELHGSYIRDMEPGFEVKGDPLPKLRFAKLFAYLPRGVAKWVLRSGATIERLELGMLDRPISSNLYDDPPNNPLPEEILPPDDLADDEDYEDWGSLRGEAVIPRPLGGFVPDGDICLPRLKLVHLCQPSNIHERNGAIDYTWSTRAEKAALTDWQRILEASSKTLETLVLQQRPGAEQIEIDSTEANEFMEYNTSGYGTGELVDMLEPFVLDREAFPALKRVYLYGMAVGEVEEARPVERVPAGRLMLRLEERGVGCEARLGMWCSFESDTGETRWARSTADDDDDEDEDKSDGEEKLQWDSVLARV